MDIHVINRNDKYVVFHPESLSLFLVTEDIGKILKLYESESNSPDSIITREDSSRTDVEKLLNYFDERSKTRACKDLEWEIKEPKTLCLFISQDCNLRCDYCFADHGAFGGEEKLRLFAVLCG